MKKITELTEMRWRTVNHRDEYGNLIRDTEDFEAIRPVNVVSSGPRFAHFIIDFTCFQVVIYVVNYFFQLLLNFTNFSTVINLTIGLITFIVILVLYPGLYAFCEHKWQRTPAKYLTKSIVIDEYGNKPELRSIVLRSVVRFVPFEPFSCLSNSRGWHDRWSNTWVVSEEELVIIKKIQEEQSKTTD